MNSKSVEEKNIGLLKSNFRSIADITVTFGRYDLILHSYEDIEAITRFVEEKTDIKSWTALKTRVSSDNY